MRFKKKRNTPLLSTLF